MPRSPRSCFSPKHGQGIRLYAAIKAPDGFKQRAARYAGNYRVNRHSHTANEKLFGLISAFSVAPTDHNTLVISQGSVAWEYVEVAPSTFRRTDSDQMIAFAEDAAGEVSYLLTPVSLAFIGAYRIPAHESPAFLGSILAFALLCFIIAIVSPLRHWRQDRKTIGMTDPWPGLPLPADAHCQSSMITTCA